MTGMIKRVNILSLILFFALYEKLAFFDTAYVLCAGGMIVVLIVLLNDCI